jgi:hypothetical protein
MELDLSAQIGSLRLKNPLMAASGCFGYGVEYAGAGDIARHEKPPSSPTGVVAIAPRPPSTRPASAASSGAEPAGSLVLSVERASKSSVRVQPNDSRTAAQTSQGAASDPERMRADHNMRAEHAKAPGDARLRGPSDVATAPPPRRSQRSGCTTAIYAAGTRADSGDRGERALDEPYVAFHGEHERPRISKSLLSAPDP